MQNKFYPILMVALMIILMAALIILNFEDDLRHLGPSHFYCLVGVEFILLVGRNRNEGFLYDLFAWSARWIPT